MISISHQTLLIQVVILQIVANYFFVLHVFFNTILLVVLLLKCSNRSLLLRVSNLAIKRVFYLANQLGYETIVSYYSTLFLSAHPLSDDNHTPQPLTILPVYSPVTLNLTVQSHVRLFVSVVRVGCVGVDCSCRLFVSVSIVSYDRLTPFSISPQRTIMSQLTGPLNT